MVWVRQRYRRADSMSEVLVELELLSRRHRPEDWQFVAARQLTRLATARLAAGQGVVSVQVRH